MAGADLQATAATIAGAARRSPAAQRTRRRRQSRPVVDFVGDPQTPGALCRPASSAGNSSTCPWRSILLVACSPIRVRGVYSATGDGSVQAVQPAPVERGSRIPTVALSAMTAWRPSGSAEDPPLAGCARIAVKPFVRSPSACRPSSGLMLVFGVLAVVLSGKSRPVQRRRCVPPVGNFRPGGGAAGSISRLVALAALLVILRARSRGRRGGLAIATSRASDRSPTACSARSSDSRRGSPCCAGRRPTQRPRIPALLAAEIPIVAFEGDAGLPLFVFRAGRPLHLPAWIPVLVIAGMSPCCSRAWPSSRGRATLRSQQVGLACCALSARAGQVVVLVVIGVIAQVRAALAGPACCGRGCIDAGHDRGPDRDREAWRPAGRAEVSRATASVLILGARRGRYDGLLGGVLAYDGHGKTRRRAVASGWAPPTRCCWHGTPTPSAPSGRSRASLAGLPEVARHEHRAAPTSTPYRRLAPTARPLPKTIAGRSRDLPIASSTCSRRLAFRWPRSASGRGWRGAETLHQPRTWSDAVSSTILTGFPGSGRLPPPVHRHASTRPRLPAGDRYSRQCWGRCVKGRSSSRSSTAASTAASPDQHGDPTVPIDRGAQGERALLTSSARTSAGCFAATDSRKPRALRGICWPIEICASSTPRSALGAGRPGAARLDLGGGAGGRTSPAS